MIELTAVQARIIGSLAEKQLTTPQQYPLSLNALVLACNQSSNREPVVAYDEATVEIALTELKEAGLVRFVHPSHGRSVTRYRQVLDERYGLDPRGLSILAVLLLRGAQTVGELRMRTERMADFDNLASVEAELERLSSGPEPLARRLPRQPGQKEERWLHLLTGEPPEAPPGAPSIVVAPRGNASNVADEVSSLRADVEALRSEVADLRDTVNGLRAALGD